MRSDLINSDLQGTVVTFWLWILLKPDWCVEVCDQLSLAHCKPARRAQRKKNTNTEISRMKYIQYCSYFGRKSVFSSLIARSWLRKYNLRAFNLLLLSCVCCVCWSGNIRCVSCEAKTNICSVDVTVKWAALTAGDFPWYWWLCCCSSSMAEDEVESLLCLLLTAPPLLGGVTSDSSLPAVLPYRG